MADTILDRVNKNKKLVRDPVTGQLVEMSESGIQEEAKQLGMQAPPTSPLGGAGMGSSPDQAKMLGDGRQKAAAFKMAVEPSQSLQTAQRRDTGIRQATQGEQQAAQKSQALQALDTITSSRVKNLVSAEIAAASPEITQSTALTVKEDAPPAYLDKLSTIAAEPTSAAGRQSLVDLANQLREEDPSKSPELIEQEISDMLGGADLGGAVAESLSTIMVVGSPENLGLEPTEYDEVAAALGITSEQLADMQLSELSEKLEGLERDEMQRTQELQDLATNPNVSAAARQEARRELRELGASGVRATEEDLEQLVDQVEAGQTVSFGGQDYTVDELLSEDTLSQLVSDYLSDEEFAAKLTESEPEFAAFIEQNKAVLEDATDELDQAGESFVDIQNYNSTIANISDDLPDLPDEAMKIFVGDSWGEFQPNKMEIPSIIKVLRSPRLSSDAKANLVRVINEVKNSPYILKEISKLSRKDLNKLGLSEGNTGVISKWANAQKSVKGALNALSNGKAKEYIVSKLQYKGKPISYDQALKMEKSKYQATGNKSPLLKALLNPEKYIKNKSYLMSLKDVAENDNIISTGASNYIKGMQPGFEDESSGKLKLYDMLADGKLGKDDLSNISISEAYKFSKLNGPAISPVKGKLEKVVSQARDKWWESKITNTLRDYPNLPGMNEKRLEYLEGLQNKYKNAPWIVLPKKLEAEIDATKERIAKWEEWKADPRNTPDNILSAGSPYNEVEEWRDDRYDDLTPGEEIIFR